MSFRVPEKFRVRNGLMPSSEADGNNGCFFLRLRHKQMLYAIASDGGGWEHVSVSRRDRTPTWEEMAQVKSLFWGEEDYVVQIHPPRSEYVNNHPYCLHLWRPTEVDFPRPPYWMVGVKGVGLC